jgi:hypothetical protein
MGSPARERFSTSWRRRSRAGRASACQFVLDVMARLWVVVMAKPSGIDRLAGRHGALGHITSMTLAASCGVGTDPSPTTFSPCGFKHPPPDALCVFRRELAALQEATPSLRRLAWQARKNSGPPLPGPRSRGDAASPPRLGLFEDCTRWEDPGFQASPQRHEPLACSRHNPDAPQAFTAATKALAKPATQGTLRLVAQPTPRQLGGHPAHMPVTGCAHPLVSGTLATVIRRRCSAR